MLKRVLIVLVSLLALALSGVVGRNTAPECLDCPELAPVKPEPVVEPVVVPVEAPIVEPVEGS